MNIKIIYPTLSKSKRNKAKAIQFLGKIFLLLAVASIIVNIILKGKPWALIACLGLYMIWIFIFSPTLIEYNRMDQSVKLLTLTCLLLHFIDIFFARGFGVIVIPICLFSGLIVSLVLLFSNYEKQKNNIFPVYLLLIFSITIGIIGIISDKITVKWVYIVLLSISGVYLLICTFFVKNNIFKEIRKRFSIK